MKLLCKTCNKLKQDTNFNFLVWSLELDVSKCQLCISPHMNDEIKAHCKDFINKQNLWIKNNSENI